MLCWAVTDVDLIIEMNEDIDRLIDRLEIEMQHDVDGWIEQARNESFGNFITAIGIAIILSF